MRKSSTTTNYVLDNGLQLVHIATPGSASGIFGVLVLAGSRNDSPIHPGMAHFVEHTLFKGTRRRSAWHIINRMEAVGGELNAYTTKEETVVYSIFPGANPARACELISDLVQHSQFPERELTKEREVVADEIDSYLDTPSEAVFDDFEELVFAGTSLAHNILGSKKSLSAFTSQACREYMQQWYVPDNMVAFYCGGRSASGVLECVKRYFGDMPPAQAIHPAETIAPLAPFNTLRNYGNHQAHTVLGKVLPYSYGSDERFALALLTNIIGGPGMNSLLNVELRERRGLVYSVEASSTLLTDCGLFTIYFGCDPDDTERCRSIATDVIARIAHDGLSPQQLARAKKQYLGQWTIAGENRENTILAAARTTLLCGGPTPRSITAQKIADVSADQIQAVAAILNDASSLTFC